MTTVDSGSPLLYTYYIINNIRIISINQSLFFNIYSKIRTKKAIQFDYVSVDFILFIWVWFDFFSIYMRGRILSLFFDFTLSFLSVNESWMCARELSSSLFDFVRTSLSPRFEKWFNPCDQYRSGFQLIWPQWDVQDLKASWEKEKKKTILTSCPYFLKKLHCKYK